MKLKKLIMAIVMLFGCHMLSHAQEIAIKTNLIGWATTSANIGAEFGVGRQSTIQVFGTLNPWKFGDTCFKFWNVMPEYRYWFCEKFNGHFIGIHALGGEYNVHNIKVPLTTLPDLTGDNKGRHVEGWYVGGGITYGYQWMLSKHWNFEASLGVGYAYSPYRYYGRCDRMLDKDGNILPEGSKETDKTHYFGPTKLALSIMYVF